MISPAVDASVIRVYDPVQHPASIGEMGSVATKTCGVCNQDVRSTGVEIWNVYDGVLIWEGSCGHAWPSFPEADPLYHKALEVLETWGGSMVHASSRRR